MQIKLCDPLLGMKMPTCANDADSSPLGLLRTEGSSTTAPVTALVRSKICPYSPLRDSDPPIYP